MNAHDGPAVALAKVGALTDSAEEMKDTTGPNPWGFICSYQVFAIPRRLGVLRAVSEVQSKKIAGYEFLSP